MMLQRFPDRPESMSFPLAATFLLIDRLREKDRRLVILLPILTIVWANFYGSGSFMGLLLIGFFVFRELVSDNFRFKKEQRFFYLVSALSIPASLIKGYGLKSLLYFYYYIPRVSQYEGEWASLVSALKNLRSNYLIGFQYQVATYLVFLAVYVVIFILSLRKILPNKFLAILSLAAVAPLVAMRQITLAAILSLPFIAKMIEEGDGTAKKITAGLTLTAAIGLLGLYFYTNPPKIENSSDISRQNFVDFVKKSDLKGKAFNHLNLGGFITYSFYPDILVFYDTRDELYLNTGALADLRDIYSTGKSVIPVLEKYKIDIVLGDIVNDGINYKDLFYSKDWSVVFFDDRYLIAIPEQTAKDRKLMDIDFLDPYSPNGVKSGEEEKAIEYYGNSNRNSFSNRVFLANSLLFLGRASEAIKVLMELPVGTGPYSKIFKRKDKDHLLATAYLKENRCPEAKARHRLS